MKTQIAIPVDTKTFLRLADFLNEHADPRDPVTIVEDAIWYWMDNASWKPELFSKTDARGYQWKNLFLPTDTQIRMQYKGIYFYAKVDGDEVIYENEPISPATLANKITQSSRNAWRDLWIKRPKDAEWKLADDLRGSQNAAEVESMKELDALLMEVKRSKS
ncbi:MAG: hypothetical protein ACKVN9_07580 [Methylophilaceae bacterium]